MKSKICILVRHGEALTHEKGLTAAGFLTIKNTAEEIIKKLCKQNISYIDLAIVSNAPRCQITFAFLLSYLMEKKIFIKETEIKQKYFCDQKKPLRENIEYGSKNIFGKIITSNKQNILVVTHGEVAENIYFNLTKFQCLPLELGKYIFFTYQ